MRNVSREEVATAKEINPNASDGSLRKYQAPVGKPETLEEQNNTIEIFDDQTTVSRLTPGHESSFKSVIAQDFKIPNPIEMYKHEIEHKYRGKEIETMNREIPGKAWDDAYKSFPELAQLGERDTKRLIKAIIANELEHYAPSDLGQDMIAKTGHGGAMHNNSLGFSQIAPDGIKNMTQKNGRTIDKGRAQFKSFSPIC